MSRILDFVRNGGQQQQPQQINQQEAQNQWNRFLGQFGGCNPNQIMDQMIQQGQITPQQRDMAMNVAKTLTGFFRL